MTRSSRALARTARWCLPLFLSLLVGLDLAPPARAASTGTTALLTPQGSGSTTAQGDFIGSAGGLDTPYRYFIEVPPGLPRLVIDLFDADVGAGGAGEAGAGRDRARGAFNTTATYTLIDPAGRPRLTRFTTGDAGGPAGADNAWLTLFDSTGDDLLDTFSAVSYADQDGTVPWSGNWIETNDNGNPANGQIQVTGGALRISDNGGAPSSIERQADLAGQGFTDATLSFDFQTQNVEPGDQLAVEVSDDGGSTWTRLETFTGAFGPSSRSYDISAFIATATRVRFIEVGGYTGTDFFFVDNLTIRTTGITAGHWELQVDQSAASTGGNDINALGLRAHDGDPGAGGTEIDVYYDSQNEIGVNPPTSGNNSRSYAYFPYVTSGCSYSANDFDYDSDAGNTGTLGLTSRSGAFTQSLASGSLSTNNVWNRNTISGWTTNDVAGDYGIWRLDASITSYINGAGQNGNYANLYFGTSQAPANPPLSNPTADTYRVYLPSDAGGAPAKPYLEQLLTYVSGPNPPAAGQTTRLSVTVRLVNPSPFPITFQTPADVVTTHVPGGAVAYAGGAQVGQGTLVSQPAVGGSGDVEWDPGTVGADTTAILGYRVDVTPPTSTFDIAVTGEPGSGDGTRGRFIDGTGNATQARATYLFGELCPLRTDSLLATYVSLTGLGAYADGDRVVVEWTTASEAGTAGFRLYRRQESSGGYQPVGDGFLPALAGAPQGGTYRLVDPEASPGEPYDYLLAEVETSGRQRFFGPFRGRSEARAAEGGFDLADLPYSATPRAPHPAPSHAAAPRRAASVEATRRHAPGEADIEVTREGLYFVPLQDLSSALGVSPAAGRSLLRGRSLSLSTLGRPVAWLPAPGARGLYFFGETIDSPFTDRRPYRLAVGHGIPLGTARGLRPPGQAPGGQVFTDTLHAERDAVAVTVLPLDPDSDDWFWAGVTAGSPTSGSHTFELTATGVAATSADAALAVALQGATDTPHHALVRLNGVELGETSWSGISAHRATFRFSQELLVEGSNRVEVSGLLDPSVAFSGFFVDSFDLTYARLYRAQGAATFVAGGDHGRVTVDGLPRPDVWVLDVTRPRRPRRVPATVAIDGSGAHVTFAPAPGASRYLVTAAADALAPASVRPVSPPSLRRPGAGADYLVIAPAELADAARILADYREGQGLTTRVVTLEAIYDEMAHGLADPRTIRDFLAYARSSWDPAPRYVVLVGRGTFDYRDLEGLGGNLLPPLGVSTAAGIFPSDSRLADLDGDDGLPDLAIGRLPVASPEELSTYLDKVRAYEASGGSRASSKALFLSDDPDAAGDFPAASDALSALLPAPFEVLSIHLGAEPIDVARGHLLAALAQGSGFLSYLGHGGLDRLADEGLLTNLDVPALANGGHPALLAAMTCNINRFDVPGFPSLGEALVLAAGGPVAVWAPSGLSTNGPAQFLEDRFLRAAFGAAGLRLGDAIGSALAAASVAGAPRDMLSTYNLLGDPALRIQVPAQRLPPARHDAE